MGRWSRKNFWLICLAAAAIILVAVAQIPVGGEDLRQLPGSSLRAIPMDLTAFSSAPPDHPLDLLFIHHSVGGQWLADPGPEVGQDCVYVTYPDGGSLRARLEQQGYLVHEASYSSQVGDQTDLFDWLPKFRDHMAQVLACARQDAVLTPPARNRIVLFKSCFPNNAFEGDGTPPGDPRGPALTLANAQATYLALLPEFQKYPDVLFVCVTTPPEALRLDPQPLWKALARRVLGKADRSGKLLARAATARRFANWLQAGNGWLKGYELKNVAVFDYYDILTGDGASDGLQYPTGGGYDSHPSSEGQRRATEALLPFLNRAVRRAGLSP
jgi:hypothetical protein